MQLNDVVTMFGADLQRGYGEKIHKISLHGGFNCPNRDGFLGRGGCTFCNVASFFDEQQQQFSIQQQTDCTKSKKNPSCSTLSGLFSSLYQYLC